jgi:hypothetical protein
MIFGNANPCIFYKRSGIDLAEFLPGLSTALPPDGILKYFTSRKVSQPSLGNLLETTMFRIWRFHNLLQVIF